METAYVYSSSSSQHYLHGATDDHGFDGKERFTYTIQNEEDMILILRGILEEVDAKGRKLFEGFVSRVENRVRMDERHFRQTWDHCKGKGASDMLEKLVGELERRGNCNGGERGINGGTLSKLERFKVKTVNMIGVGVVKEEEQQKK